MSSIAASCRASTGWANAPATACGIWEAGRAAPVAATGVHDPKASSANAGVVCLIRLRTGVEPDARTTPELLEEGSPIAAVEGHAPASCSHGLKLPSVQGNASIDPGEDAELVSL